MADRWFQSSDKFGLLKIITPSLFNGFLRGWQQILFEHLKSNITYRFGVDLFSFRHNLQANGAQSFWDTLYKKKYSRYLYFPNFQCQNPESYMDIYFTFFKGISLISREMLLLESRVKIEETYNQNFRNENIYGYQTVND